MRKLLCLIAFSGMMVPAFSQDCKFEINKKDKFSGQTTVGYTYIVGRVSFSMQKTGELVTTNVFISFTDGTTQAVEKGQELQFRLANGEFVKMTARDRTEPQVKGTIYTEGSSVNATTTTANYRVNFDISQEDLVKLSQSAPVAFKMQIGKEFSNDIPEKKGLKMMEAYKCLLNYKAQ